MPSIFEQLQRPGIDPRDWVRTAIVGTLDPETQEIITDDADDPKRFVHTGEDETLGDIGPMVDCVVIPSQDPVQARLMSANGGDNTCVWFPIHGGDEVLIALPGGKPENIPVIVGRLNSEKHPAPKEWDNENILMSLGEHGVQAVNDAGSFVTWDADGALTYRHPSGMTVQFGNDGHFRILDKDKNLLFSDSDGVNVVTDSGAVMKLGSKVQIVSPDAIDLAANGPINAACSGMVIGKGSGTAVIFEQLLIAITAAFNAAAPTDGGKAAFGALMGAINAAKSTNTKLD